MSIKLSSNGFTAIETVLCIVILAIIGGTGYYVYHANKKTNEALNAASQVSSSSPPKLTKKKTTPKASATTVTATTPPTNYFSIKEWSVKAAYTGSSQLSYTIDDLGGGAQAAGFTSSELAAISNDCKISGAGLIERSNGNTVLDQAGTTPAQSAKTQSPYSTIQLGGFYYTYIPPQGVCTSNATLEHQAQADTKSLIATLQAS